MVAFPLDGWVPDLGCCPNWDDYTPEQQQRALDLATGSLWALTGRKFGTFTVIARPCNAPLNPPLYRTYPVNLLNPWGTDGGAIWAPYIWNGEWHNAGCGGIDCCRYRCGLALDGPVVSVTEVSIDGEVLDSDAYVIDDGYILRRVDGDCWPLCSETFLVTYVIGTPVPDLANIALGDLACAYAAACVSGDCALPARMTSLTRQGISVDFTSPDQFPAMGLTNIATVDRIVAQLNPHGQMAPPLVTSPDMPSIRYQTWP